MKDRPYDEEIDGRFVGVMLEVMDEINRAIGKHGIHNVPFTPTVSLEKAYMIFSEEAGEVVMAINDRNIPGARKEYVQSAAMAVASIIGIDRRADGE